MEKVKLSDKFYTATEEYNDFSSHVPAPYMRKTFTLEKKPEKAVISICGLGFYRLFINGTEITKGHLAPYISNPDDICCYDVYDVTQYLAEGKNAVGVILGNGMLNSPGGKVWDFEKAAFRSAPKLAFLLCADGKNVIPSAKGFVTHPSPILFDDLRSGERCDARNVISGWADADFDDSGWEKVKKAETPKGKKHIVDTDPIVCSRILQGTLIGKASLNHGRKDVVKNYFPACYDVPEDEKGTEGYLFDFGENTGGIVGMRIDAKAGQKIILQMGECLENGVLDLDQMYFLPDHYDHRCVYICREGVQIYLPSFTYFGARYCLVMGITEEQAKNMGVFFCVCHSGVKKIGDFHCSNSVANRIYDACMVSDLSNLWYFPTDCPQREKNGWTGDASLSAEQFMTSFSCERTFAEWLRHIRAAQKPSGELPGIVPTGGWGFAWGNGPAWDAVCVNLPYEIYRFTGDVKILKENAGMIWNYFRYMLTKQKENGLYAYGLGDWCPVGGKIKPPLELTDSVTLMDIMSKAAKIFSLLGEKDKAEEIKNEYARLRNAIRANLINEDLVAAGSCQTSQAMCLYYGIFDESEYKKAFGILLDLIKAADDHIDTGVLGARCIFRLLADNGEEELAWKMITRTDAPSYGNWIATGATSMYENFGYPQSRNHHFFGDVSAFMINYVAGIRVNTEFDDSGCVEISPCFIKELDFASGETNGVKVEWYRTDKGVTLRVDDAGVYYGRIVLREGKFADGTTEKPLASGVYEITIQN